ncbi:hypothetical protein D3C86_1814240 [compost metagenome]
MDKGFDLPFINKDQYAVFLETSMISKVTNMDAETYLNSSMQSEVHLPGFTSGTVKKYGLTVLPMYGYIGPTGFFPKNKEITYWTSSFITKVYLDDILYNGMSISVGDKSMDVRMPK